MAGMLMTFPVGVVNSRGAIRDVKEELTSSSTTDAQIPKLASRKDASQAKTCIMIEARSVAERVEDSKKCKVVTEDTKSIELPCKDT